MTPEEIFLKPDDIVDTRYIEVIKLTATVGGTQSINDLKIIFSVSNNMSTWYGRKHLNINHLITKEDVIRKIKNIKEITMINEEDCIYFLKKYKYDSNKAISYILNKKDENMYDEKLNKLRKIYTKNLFNIISNCIYFILYIIMLITRNMRISKIVRRQLPRRSNNKQTIIANKRS